MAVTTFLSVANRATGNLNAGIGVSDTSLTLQSGQGALFPAANFILTINSERMLVATRSTDTLSGITRGYDGTTAEVHLTGAVASLNIVKKHYDDQNTAINGVEAMTFPGVTFAQGGIPYRASSGDGALSPLAKGTANQVLKMAADASLPQWRDEYGAASIVIGETPTGTINGVTTAFTLAATQATGSLEVFLNGQRMTGGGADYTESAGGFTMVIAPLTGDVLRANYYKTVDFAVVGTNSLVEDETPTGTVNGSNVNFTVLKGSFIANSLAVYLNGQKLTHTADFTETTPGSGTFAFVTAPATGAVVRVGYQFNSNASGNADTVDGFHASSTATASTILPLNGSGQFPTTVLGAGALVQQVSAAYSTPYVALTSPDLPIDDTIPQTSEMTLILSQAITPKATTNRLLITATVFGSGTAATNCVSGIFQDANTSALAVGNYAPGDTDYMFTYTFQHEMAAGTTSSTTFKLYCGRQSGGQFNVLGNAGTRKFGAVGVCRLTIQEIAA